MPRLAKKPRVRLTHIEIRRGESLRLRVAVAHDALAEVGDELGALIKKIAPAKQTSIVDPTPMLTPIPETAPVEEFVVDAQHNGDDDAYHATLREHLTGLIGALCDTALSDALHIVQEEQARRVEITN